MRRLARRLAAPLTLALAGIALVAAPLAAALRPGARAPDFVTRGALAGKVIPVDLGQMLKKGPVVLYFYPKAFTSGCTLEARAFSQAMDRFHAAGAQVIGLSIDNLADLKRFSVEECRSAFPVAVADKRLVTAYKALMPGVGAVRPISNRTTYVIGRDGRVAMAYSALKWNEHVPRALAAVEALKARRG